MLDLVIVCLRIAMFVVFLVAIGACLRGTRSITLD